MARTATVQIKQIAERVGLSPSTVSIVLNGRGDEMRISKESQRRVLEAAKEMSYRPAGNARHPRTIAEDQAEKTVGVFWNVNFGEDTMSRYFYGLFKGRPGNRGGLDPARSDGYAVGECRTGMVGGSML